MGSVLDSKGTVWVFGENNQGELGVGDTTHRLSPYPIVSLQGKGIS
jgi:alpha-tubulin suppressor-like RCC1 family protein